MADIKRRLENLERYYSPANHDPRYMTDQELAAEIARLLLAAAEPEPEATT
jgi:hypothetical protein